MCMYMMGFFRKKKRCVPASLFQKQCSQQSICSESDDYPSCQKLAYFGSAMLEFHYYRSFPLLRLSSLRRAPRAISTIKLQERMSG